LVKNWQKSKTMNRKRNITYLLGIAGKNDGRMNKVVYGDRKTAFYWNDREQMYVNCHCEGGVWSDVFGNVWNDDTVTRIEVVTPDYPNNLLMMLTAMRNWQGCDDEYRK